MGIYWPLEEQMLAAGGEVLLERLPAAGRGSSRQREWRLAEGSGKRLGRQRYFWRRQSLGKGREGRFRELQRRIVQLRGGEVLLGGEIEKKTLERKTEEGKNTREKNRGAGRQRFFQRGELAQLLGGSKEWKESFSEERRETEEGGKILRDLHRGFLISFYWYVFMFCFR